MNFRIDIEMTPEELRRALGLPDVSGLQQDMIDKVREQMESGAEGYDPLTLLKPYLNSGIGSMDAFQKLVFGMMNQYGKGGRDAD
ncbi:DUF6489 family protein [Marinobacterium weihaiense]|uniref:Uncharacterized protein n=1 Tax=Marinobacterium weihaiense TaxID=2851016 RepID=A0ABS6M6M7_9GAMM|nr:DUF6489 family protein [Marinobacterium weihaiense]MBV0931929.1 hypothetical protein [Marinobacterium weihaiense]